MRSNRWSLVGRAGAAGLAAALFSLVSATAHSWQGDLQADPLHEARQREQAAAPARKRTMSAVGNPRVCGKCHTACEPGRTHESRPATQREGTGLPLTADGRMTCLSCHRPHGEDAGTRLGLRLPVLKRELCLACHAPAAADAPRLDIVSPPPGAIIREERLALIGRVSGAADAHLTVRLNDDAFHVQAGEGRFVTWLTLREGVNRCEIAAGGRVLWSGEIFRGDSGAAGYARSASGHRTASQQQCRDCHDGAGAEQAASGGALCYGCHERLDAKRYVHGPLGVGACLACHDPHSGYGAAHLRDEQAALCGGCHAPREAHAAGACASAGKACADCHDPHQSDVRYLLRGPQYTFLGERPARR